MDRVMGRVGVRELIKFVVKVRLRRRVCLRFWVWSWLWLWLWLWAKFASGEVNGGNSPAI